MQNKILEALGNEKSVIHHFYNVISTSKWGRIASLGEHLLCSYQYNAACSLPELTNRNIYLMWALSTLFRMGLFGATHSWLLPKICHWYSQWWNFVIIPYLKKIQKIYTPFSPADISNFFTGNHNSCYIKKYRYRLHFNT